MLLNVKIVEINRIHLKLCCTFFAFVRVHFDDEKLIQKARKLQKAFHYERKH